MSDFENPYQSPQAASVPETPLSQGPALTDAMLRYLKEASPWLRFIGVLGFIGCGFTLLGGIIFSFIGSAAASWLSSFSMDAVRNIPSLLIGIIYIGYGALLFFPAFFTYRFGVQIRNYFSGNSEEALELAFKNNKALWKFKGILSIIGLSSIPVFIIIGIIAGLATVLSAL
jgi:hypothetical protein